MKVKLNSCFYSSFIFLTNVFAGFYYYQILYTYVYLYLFLTSVYYHSSYRRLAYFLDQIGCVMGGCYSFYLAVDHFFRLSSPEMTYFVLYMGCLFYTIASYYLGRVWRMFSHHPDKRVGNYFHSVLHIVASLGCNAALYLSMH